MNADVDCAKKITASAGLYKIREKKSRQACSRSAALFTSRSKLVHLPASGFADVAKCSGFFQAGDRLAGFASCRVKSKFSRGRAFGFV